MCHWKRRGFLTSTGTPIKHLNHQLDLYYALSEPTLVAVVGGHQKGKGKIARGNNAADLAAKAIAGYNVCKQLSQKMPAVEVHRELCVQKKISKVTDLISQHWWHPFVLCAVM